MSTRHFVFNNEAGVTDECIYTDFVHLWWQSERLNLIHTHTRAHARPNKWLPVTSDIVTSPVTPASHSCPSALQPYLLLLSLTAHTRDSSLAEGHSLYPCISVCPKKGGWMRNPKGQKIKDAIATTQDSIFPSYHTVVFLFICDCCLNVLNWSIYTSALIKISVQILQFIVLIVRLLSVYRWASHIH